jgi:branched-chain amino acid transport system substrate-binding protein
MKSEIVRVAAAATKQVCVGAIGVGLVFGAGTAALAFQEDGTVRIGMLESQTGQYAPFGLPGVWGSRIAIDEINEAGGVLIDGQKVKIEIVPSPNGEDAGGDPGHAVALVRKFVFDDQVLLIKGLSSSNTGQAVFNYLNELNSQGNPIVVHSSAVGAPGLGAISEWGFRNTFSENYVVEGMVKALKEQGVETAGFYIMQDNVYYPSIVETAIKPALEAEGIEIVSVTEGVSSDTNFSRQVNELRSANPDAVYVLANTLPAINFMKEARRRGLSPQYFIGGIAQLTADTLKSGADAVDGMLMVGSYDPASESVLAFAEEYRSRHGQDISLFAVNAYEAIYMIKEALENADIKNTRDTLDEDRRKFQEAFKNVSITSITGETIAFNEVRDTPKQGVILTVKDGAFVAWEPGAGN